MDKQDKKRQRKLKRVKKRDGNKKRRQFLKQTLRENPEEAHLEDDCFLYGEESSDQFNNLDGRHKNDVG